MGHPGAYVHCSVCYTRLTNKYTKCGPLIGQSRKYEGHIICYDCVRDNHSNCMNCNYIEICDICKKFETSVLYFVKTNTNHCHKCRPDKIPECD